MFYFSSPKNYSFLTRSKDFLENPVWGMPYVKRYFGKVFLPYIGFKEMIIHDTPLLNYEGKTILIVGGGPSALEVRWQDMQTDAIWSCNHFFLHPDLSQRQVDLFAVGNEVNLNHPKLLEYMDKFSKSTALFETTNRKIGQIKEYASQYPATFCHTRYRSQIGVGARLLVLATLLGVKEVHFVGIDGLPTSKTTHAFQPGKKPLGSPNNPNALKLFQDQYAVLWDYIKQMNVSGTVYHNLGAGIKGNITGQI